MNEESFRNRTIRWPVEIDAIAREIAYERRFDGGVSELLVRLVSAERKRKRGISHLHPKK